MIATIAEKKKFSDHIETTLQRSQRQRSLRKNFLHLSDCCRCDRWRVVSYDRYDRCGRWSFFFFWAIVAIIWKPGLIYRNNHPPFLLNSYLYALQTYRTHSSKLRLLLVIRCISLVVDFVLLGGTNSVLLIWGLIVWILNKSQDPYHYRNCCSFHPPHSLNFDFKVFVFWESFSYFNWSVLFGGDGHINEQAVFFFFVLDYNVWSVGLYLTICLYWRIPQDCDVIFFCYCLGLMPVLFLVCVYIHLFADVPV